MSEPVAWVFPSGNLHHDGPDFQKHYPEARPLYTADAIREAVLAEQGECARLRFDAIEVFDANGPETPQVVRDVIEWFASAILARGDAA